MSRGESVSRFNAGVRSVLGDRIDELETHSERDLPGRSAEELRELGVKAYESVAPRGDAVILGARLRAHRPLRGADSQAETRRDS